MDSRVSVVVVTMNRRDELLRTLGRLTALAERPRVVVVDNASADGTAEAVRASFPAVEVVRLPRNVGGAGRNVGVERVDTPYVAFADDDSWWAPGALARAADVLDAHPRLAVLNARILVGPEERLDAISAEMEASPLPRPPDAPGTPLLGFVACAAVVRRRAFLEVGGFEARHLVGGEEEHLAASLATAGWAMAYVPEVVAHHHPSRLRDWDGRRRIGIRNTLWFAWRRRPLASAVRRTVLMARNVPVDRVSLGGFADALRGLPWVLREREVVPASVETGLRLLERDQLKTGARRYASEA